MATIALRDVVRYAPAACIDTAGPTDDTRASSIVCLTGPLADVIRQIQNRRTSTGTILRLENSVVTLSDHTICELDWEFLPLITILAEANASAVSVHLPPAGELPRSVRELAHRRHLPVLVVKDPWLFASAVIDLLAGTSHIQGRLIQRTTEKCRQPYDSLNQLLQRINAAIGHPINLSDSDGLTIACYPASDPAQEVGIVQCDELTTSTSTSSQYVPDGRSRVIIPVSTAYGTRSLLTTAIEGATRSEFDAVVTSLEVASLAVSGFLANRRVDLERNARSRTALLSDLIESAASVPRSLYARARDAGWSLSGYHMAARAIVRNDVDLVGRRPELERSFAKVGLHAVAVEQSDGWVMWISFDSRPETSQTNAWGTAWRQLQQSLRPSIPTQLGVGTVQHGTEGLARSLSEASDAARIAAGRENHGYFVQIDRLNIAQRLLAWTNTESLLPAASEVLEPLRDRPDAILTLHTYLDSESSLVESAAILGIHRNTVRDRIARIRNDLSVDLDDPDTRLALQLACRSVLAVKQQIY